VSFAGKLGILQRVLPRYRAHFFDLLAAQCAGGLSVFAGQPRPSEAIVSATNLSIAQWHEARNLHLFSGPFYLCYQRGLLDWLVRWNPDALIVEANPRYLSTPTAVRWMRVRRRPVLGWGLGTASVPPLAAWRRNFLRSLDGVIAYSEHGAQQYRDLGIERVFVAPNAVAPRPAAPPARGELRGRATLLYVGRLQTRKRLDALLRACATLPTALQPKLVIVGEGPAYEELETLARKLYPQTEFTGALFGASLGERFDQADLFVLPGTGGLAVQQAMAHALPIIVAEGDGSQANLVDATNGWLIPTGDDAALHTALAAALSDPARLRKMGQASFQRVQNEFNLENMVAQFVAALNAVSH
jgi:glycosyltransferase involved in cell wall biosynthesis